ncbi:SLC39A13 (predicted) [Pycnogonum litorale]
MWIISTLSLIILTLSSTHSNIHRTYKSKMDVRSNVVDHPAHHQNSTLLFHSKLLEAQTFSIIASLFVGLSGILPLLIIPLEAGPCLKTGAGARSLRLLLSFAVGGLLGDVFLHLLPESWKHISSYDESAHRTMGVWVMTGILTFIIIEMIFTASHDDEKSDELEEKRNEKYTNAANVSNGCVRKRIINNNSCICNGDGGSTAVNGHCNGTNDANTRDDDKKQKIHIAGYLNLFANIMDNFTHGLAISASFLNCTRVGILTTFAILIHEVPHEIGDFAILLKSGFNRWGAAKAQMVTATFGLCGALTALIVDSADEIGTKTAFLLPFTAGGFIQIALVNVLPDLLKQTTNPRFVRIRYAIVFKSGDSQNRGAWLCRKSRRMCYAPSIDLWIHC